jgi:hypothetical protein
MKAMRVSALILLIVLTVLGTVGVALAEKVKTNQSTKLYAGPGEQKKVLLKVRSGQNMTLLGQDGRWLKVRVQGRTGFVPRSKVDMADDDGEISRNTRRRPFVDGRSRRRGFGGEAGPDDRVGADAIGEGVDDEGGDEEMDEDVESDRPPRRVRRSRDDEEDEESSDDEEVASSDDEEVDDSRTGEPEEDEVDTRPTARVAKKMPVFEDADDESEEMFVARPTDVLYPVESKGRWTAVENEEGDFGWIETEYLEMEDGSGGMKKRQINLGARLGLMFIQQGMRSTGSSNLKVPDNYNIGTSSVTLSLGGSILMPMKKKYLVGGEAAYDYSKTLLGGIFYDPDGAQMPMPGVNTGVAIHNINVRVMGGIDLKKKSGMAVLGRLGYRYQSYLVDNYGNIAKNPAQIPQEIMKAPTLGAALLVPRLTQTIGMRASLDAILVGANLTQTKGLEDGSSPSLKAVTVGVGVNYKWKKKMDLVGTYDLRYTGINFGAPLASSMRMHMGTNTTRTDFFHMVTVGVGMPF